MIHKNSSERNDDYSEVSGLNLCTSLHYTKTVLMAQLTNPVTVLLAHDTGDYYSAINSSSLFKISS